MTHIFVLSHVLVLVGKAYISRGVKRAHHAVALRKGGKINRLAMSDSDLAVRWSSAGMISLSALA